MKLNNFLLLLPGLLNSVFPPVHFACRHKVPYHILLNFYCPVSAECPGNHADEETTSVLRSLVTEHLSHDQV